MINLRARLTVFLVLAFLVPLHVSGNPGGVGNGLEDMQCGGACHGDANQNATSNLGLDLQPSESVWVGQPAEITVKISGIGIEHNLDTLGIFLLSTTNANGDVPTSHGWEILSDGMGDANNYIEISMGNAPTSFYSHTWILRADEIGSKTLYVAVQHGDSSGSPYFGISQAFEVEVIPIPENLQRLDPEYSPTTSREIGESTELCVETVNASSVQIEWREPSGDSIQVSTSLDGDCWKAALPASLDGNTIQWRAILEGEGPTQTTPWFSLSSLEPKWGADEMALNLQSLAHIVLFFGIVLLLKIPRQNTSELKKYEASSEVIEKENSGPPLPAEGLPPGWNMEQWNHYGADYLEERL